MLEDNVQSAAAFLDAFEATGHEDWLAHAARVVAYCTAAHWDDAAGEGRGAEGGGGFFDVAKGRAATGAPYLATRAKPVQDSPTPPPTTLAPPVPAPPSPLPHPPQCPP